MVKKELWKDIEGYKSLYQVSTEGRVKSLIRKDRLNRYWLLERILKLKLYKGYNYINLGKDKELKTYLVHRLVAKAFIPNPDNKPQVNHKDGDKKNNRIDNLEWCTDKENKTHADKMLGINTRGENHVNSKLTTNEVLQIKKSCLKLTELAEKFQVSFQLISQIKNNKNWRHLI